jgi:hexokinase
MKITRQGDGEVITFAKEIKAKAVIGSKVGAELSEALVARGWQKPERVVLLNDTVAALLSGAAACTAGKRYDSFVGVILGTGLNSAYIESCVIPKLSGESGLPTSQIVVCESGKFEKIPRSLFDVEVDAATNNPGAYATEKLCSGAYLGPVVSCALRHAASDGVFSARVAASLSDIHITLKDMDQFLYAPYRTDTVLGVILKDGTEDDRAIVYNILDAFVERSARIISAIIAASVIKSGKGCSPAMPVCVVCEGTTFIKTHNLRERVEGYLDTVLRKSRRRYYELVMPENAITLGAAIAGIQ